MHLPTVVVQLLFAVQLPVCLYVGWRIARLTGRPRLNWLIYGFLAAVVFPPFGALLALMGLFVVPPARPPQAQAPHGAPPQCGDEAPS